MPKDHELHPGPESEDQDEEHEEEQVERKSAAPDYSRFLSGNRWWKRAWARKYLWPAGIGLFALVVILNKTKSVVQTSTQPDNSHDATIGQLQRNIHGNIRAQRQQPPPSYPAQPPRPPQAEPDIENGSGNQNNYAQQLAEERRQHRIAAFASPIFTEDVSTAQTSQATQSSAPQPNAGASPLSDITGLTPQQTAQLQRYLQAEQQMLQGAVPQNVPSQPGYPLGQAQSTQPAQQSFLPDQPGSQTDQAIYPAVRAVQSPSQQPPSFTYQQNRNPNQKEINAALNQAVGPFHRIFAGTVAEAALDTALEGSMTGVVLAHITRDIHTNNLLGPVLIPAGTQLVGSAAPVTSLSQPRLKVTFDMAIEPNGYTINLDQFEAMNQQGQTGLADSINNHWMRTIGIAAAVGLIEGFSELNAGVSVLSPRTEVYQGAGSEAGREGLRILDRYLNVPPTVKVNPGSRIRIVFPVGLDGIPESQNTRMGDNL
jgi:type IV secretory pathway VirB10-like protein